MAKIHVDPFFYKTLGIENFPDKEKIKKAYRGMALKHHPDRGGDAEMMKKINHIYEVLIKHKEEYDQYLRRLSQPKVKVVFTYTYPGWNNSTASGWTNTYTGW